MRLEVVPTITREGQVMLRLKLYEFREGNLILISSPEFLVANKDTAAVELSADRPAEDGAPYRFELTPIRNESVL